MSPRAKKPVSSVEHAFERLLADITSGRLAPGVQLPGERDLARSLGTSRPTLREALRRLAAWGLVSARRGSGIKVRDVRDWSLEVLPSYLRHGAPREGGPATARLVRDLLFLRRAFLVDIVRVLAGRVKPGELAAARQAIARAWQSRADVNAYVRADFEVVRSIVEAARFLPALWFLNSLGGVYFQLAETLHLAGPRLVAPDDYVSENERIVDALERGDGEEAGRIAGAYLEAHDRALLAALGVKP